MCLESALSGRLAKFFKVSPRGDAQSLERGQESSVLSKLEIEPRTPTVKLYCSSVHPWFSGIELKKSSTGAYRARFSASFYVSQSADESIALVNSRIATLLLF